MKSPSSSLSIGSILDTPRKATLRRNLKFCKRRLLDKNRKVKNLQKVNKRLKKTNATLKTAVNALRKRRDLDESVLDNLSGHVEVKDTFNALFLKNVTNKKKPFSKYPPGARKFALTLHFHSPAAYRYMRKIFHNCLPHPNTLFQWYKSVDAKPGYTTETLDRLKQKSQSSKKEILCALVADEMAIRQQKIWCGGRYIGVVDMGLGEATDNDPIAQQVYVLLLVSLNESWKIPLAYFFITGLKAEMKANIINIALEKCHAVGVKIVSLTFDGCKSNLLTMKLLGCNINNINNFKTFFEHPISKENVTVFLDACHMIKLMRNTLESKRCFSDNENKIIKWSLLCNLNNLQQKLALNLANKLTNRHIEFKNEIMKVKLATQLMSRSVAKAIQFCQDLKIPEFHNSDATIRFLVLINDLFDLLNSRNLKDPGFKKPLQSKNVSQCFAFLQNAKEYLKSLTITIKRKRTIKKKTGTRVIFISETVPLWKCQASTGVIGLLVCIESVQHLYRDVVETHYLSFLITYKVSQDHIELFFGNIRSHGGHNNNPNVQQFMAAYKKILTFIETRDKFTGNCIPLEEMPILNCGNAVTNINRSSIGYRLELELEDTGSKKQKEKDIEEAEINIYQGNCDHFAATLNEHCGHEKELILQIIGYIAGFVVRHLLKKLKCEYCKDCLLAKEKLKFHKLIDIKDLGGLCYASKDVFLICEKSEYIIRRFLRTGGCVKDKMCISILKKFIDCDVFIGINENCQGADFGHKIGLLKAIIEKYIDIRLHYAGKLKTSETKNKSKRQLYNKLNLFQGT